MRASSAREPASSALRSAQSLLTGLADGRVPRHGEHGVGKLLAVPDHLAMAASKLLDGGLEALEAAALVSSTCLL